MPIPHPLTSASRAVLALFLTIALPACAGAGADDESSAASEMGDLGLEEQPRVEVDPCGLLEEKEISAQLARAISPSQRSGWSTFEFDVTPTEVEFGISRRCEYKFVSRETDDGGNPIWHSDFSVMVIHADGIMVPEDRRRPVAGAPEIFQEAHNNSYYITKGRHAAVLTAFPGSQEGSEADAATTRIDLLRRIVARLP